jgi:hypothetical protein
MKTRTTKMWLLFFSAMLWTTYVYAQPSPSAVKTQPAAALPIKKAVQHS